MKNKIISIEHVLNKHKLEYVDVYREESEHEIIFHCTSYYRKDKIEKICDKIEIELTKKFPKDYVTCEYEETHGGDYTIFGTIKDEGYY